MRLNMHETDEEMRASLLELWAEHKAAKFPPGFRAHDMDGQDFVLLDADIAGSVSTFLSRGTLSVGAAAQLGLLYYSAMDVAPLLNEAACAYFWRLGRMAELVLRLLVREWKSDNGQRVAGRDSIAAESRTKETPTDEG